MILSKFTPIFLIFWVSVAWSGKQKIVIRLREPLRAESIKIRVPQLANSGVGAHDLEAKLELGPEIKVAPPKEQVQTLKLNLDLKTLGTNGVQVTLTLPDPGFVEVVVMDFYGKNLATLVAQEKTRGIYLLPPYFPKDLDHNGIKFVTLKLNGKMVLQKTISKVR